MAFARIEVGILNHRKFVGIDPAAGWLWALGNAYCWDQLSDGFLPQETPRRLLSWVHWRVVDRLVRELCERGLWHVYPMPGPDSCGCLAVSLRGGCGQSLGPAGPRTYLVHDWLAHNPPSERIKAEREAAKLRATKSREGKRAGVRAGERAPVRAPVRAGALETERAQGDVDVDVKPLTPLPPSSERPYRRVDGKTTIIQHGGDVLINQEE